MDILALVKYDRTILPVPFNAKKHVFGCSWRIPGMKGPAFQILALPSFNKPPFGFRSIRLEKALVPRPGGQVRSLNGQGFSASNSPA